MREARGAERAGLVLLDEERPARTNPRPHLHVYGERQEVWAEGSQLAKPTYVTVAEYVGTVMHSVFFLPGHEPFYMIPVYGAVPEGSPYSRQNHDKAQFFGKISEIRFPPQLPPQ